MLDQDVCTLLAAGPAGVGQWGQASGVPAPHIHPVLQEKAHVHSWHDMEKRPQFWRRRGSF
jgi:hypothetical protein